MLSLDVRIAIVLIAFFALKLTTALQALRLHRQVHFNPYTLAGASEDEKRKWAIRLILWRTGWVVVVPLFLLLFSDFLQVGLWRFILIGFIIWLVWAPVAIFRERYAMEKSLQSYQDWHVALRNGRTRDPKTGLRYAIISPPRLMTEELKRVEDEGFSSVKMDARIRGHDTDSLP